MTIDHIKITYPDGDFVKYRHMQVYRDNKPVNLFVFRKFECSDPNCNPKLKYCEHGELELPPHCIGNLRMVYDTLEKIGITYEEIEKD